jgi:hypothetical protein
MSVYPSHPVCLFLSSLLLFPFFFSHSRVSGLSRSPSPSVSVPHLPPRMVQLQCLTAPSGYYCDYQDRILPTAIPLPLLGTALGCCTVELRAFYQARHLHIDIPIYIPIRHSIIIPCSLRFPSLDAPGAPPPPHRPSPPSREMLPAVAYCSKVSTSSAPATRALLLQLLGIPSAGAALYCT